MKTTTELAELRNAVWNDGYCGVPEINQWGEHVSTACFFCKEQAYVSKIQHTDDCVWSVEDQRRKEESH